MAWRKTEKLRSLPAALTSLGNKNKMYQALIRT
jgi:hypothetical protein